MIEITRSNSINDVPEVNWIPVRFRKCTQEEKEAFAEVHGWNIEDINEMWDCPLPDDGEDVLVTTIAGQVDKTTFYTDAGCYFEDYDDDYILAWCKIPKPYKEGENT